MRQVKVKIGDIVKEKVDAIVNAANREMIGGGGVDGAIHRAAGPQLRVECEKFPADAHGRRIQTGEAKITIGCKLPAKFVIHTAGPDCARVHDPDEQDRLLAASWRNSLAIVAERGLKSVSFPSISTGIYGFPKERAAKIAAVEVAKFLAEHADVEVRVCLLGQDAKRTKALYEQAFAASMPITFRPCCEGQKSDIGFVDRVSLDLAFIMQRVNRQLSEGREPKPGATAYRRFKAIDYGRLCELANRNPDGLAAFSKYVYDEVRRSEASGWREWVVKPYWRPELYDKHNPEPSTCFAEWSFSSPLAIKFGIDRIARFKKVFRFYRNEPECPYNQESEEQRRLWFIWSVEECLAKASPTRILETYQEAVDSKSVPESIMSANVSEDEKICAMYVYVAADTFMSSSAFTTYFTYPIIHVC